MVIGLSVFVFSLRGRAEEFARYGYPGIFALSLMANATVILPAPSIALVFVFGGVLDPILVGLVAGAGAALGELAGYAAGYSGQAVVENAAIYERFINWLRSNERLTLIIMAGLAAIPNPFFDLVGIAAGVLKIPVARFLVAAWIGKTLLMGATALAGAYSIDWIWNLIGGSG